MLRIVSLFCNEFNNFKYYRILFITSLTLNLNKNLFFWHENIKVLLYFLQRFSEPHYVMLLNLSILLDGIVSHPDVTSCDKGTSQLLCLSGELVHETCLWLGTLWLD